MSKLQNIQQFFAKVRQKLLNWSAASVVATDPLTDEEKQQLLRKTEEKQ